MDHAAVFSNFKTEKLEKKNIYRLSNFWDRQARRNHTSYDRLCVLSHRARRTGTFDVHAIFLRQTCVLKEEV